MSDTTVEAPINSDLIQEVESEESKYRSFREGGKKKAKAKQQFKIGRTVWFTTDSDGSYRMTVIDALHHPVANRWSYKLKDSMGEDHEGWVAEKELSPANPSN